MNPAAASAATAAHQNYHGRNNTRLQPVREHPWERDPSYQERLRKPASPQTYRGPPWRPNPQFSSSSTSDGQTPSQRLDSLLDKPQQRAVAQRHPTQLTIGRPGPSARTIARGAFNSNDIGQHQFQKFTRRKPTREQLQQRSNNGPPASQQRPSGLVPHRTPAPPPCNHIPPDLVESARRLRLAGIEVPVQEPNRCAPHPSEPELEAIETRIVPRREQELERSPGSRDLLRSMEHLHFNDRAQPENARVDARLSQMTDSVTTTVAGSEDELLLIADSLADGRHPYSRIAIYGLSGSGKSHFLRRFFSRLQARAPAISIIDIDLSEPDSVQVRNDLLPGLYSCHNIKDISSVLRLLGLPSPALRLVIIKGLNCSQDVDVVLSWFDTFFSTTSCILITTRRVDIAESFATADNSLLFPMGALSARTATGFLSNPQNVSTMDCRLAKQLSHFPSALVGAAKLMRDTGVSPDELSARLSRLLRPANSEQRASTKVALEAANGFVTLANLGNRSNLDTDASALFPVLIHCVQKSWLDTFNQVDQECPAAMVILGLWAALGRDELREKTMKTMQQTLHSNNALQCLQNYCLVTESVGVEKMYHCPAPVLMAVQIWFAGRNGLDKMFQWANTAAFIEDR